MTYDRSEYDAIVAGRKAEQFPKTALTMLSQAEVKAEHVTGDAIWDWFLSYISSAVEKTLAAKEALELQNADPLLVDDNQVRRIRIEIIRCQAQIEAWTAVMSLPKDLKAMGQEAKGLLER